MTDKRTIDLLDKIGCIWSPPHSEQQLKTIAQYWQRNLLRYTDKIIDDALEHFSETFHRKPSLADFVSKCKDTNSRLAPVGAIVFKCDFITKHQHRARLTKIYGEEAGKVVDSAYAEHERAKRNGTIDNYRESVLARMHKLTHRKFSFYEVIKKN